MSKLIDLTDRKFGRLKALKRVENRGKRVYWLCECDCGTTKEIQGAHLKNGMISSCGCLNRELIIARNLKHGEGKDGHITREYRAWLHMKGRCTIPTDKAYSWYGGRGIGVYDQWKENFRSFLNDMGRCPKGYTLQRMNNDGDYEPSNCLWSPPEDQVKNKRFHNRHTGETGYFHNTPISGYEDILSAI